MTVTAAKARLSELVAAVAATQDHVDITRNGEPAAVLVSYAELNALRETIAVLSDPAAVADIEEAEADVVADRPCPPGPSTGPPGSPRLGAAYTFITERLPGT